jgi:hypothetical protein
MLNLESRQQGPAAGREGKLLQEKFGGLPEIPQRLRHAFPLRGGARLGIERDVPSLGIACQKRRQSHVRSIAGQGSVSMRHRTLACRRAFGFWCSPVGPKPPENRHKLPFDAFVPLWHNPVAMSESQNQFSLTRAASITGGAAKKQILSVLGVSS